MGNDFEKYGRLLHHLKDYKERRDSRMMQFGDKNSAASDLGRVLIFVETKKGCDQLMRSLRGESVMVRAIHGDKSQEDRDNTLAEFREGRFAVLVATDVAARGLDIKDVKMVINFDMPNTIEDYVHRIGRTGRAGAKGTSVSFFTEKHSRLAKEIIVILQEAGQEVPPGLFAMSGRGGGGGGAHMSRYRSSGGGQQKSFPSHFPVSGESYSMTARSGYGGSSGSGSGSSHGGAGYGSGYSNSHTTSHSDYRSQPPPPHAPSYPPSSGSYPSAGYSQSASERW
jgi:superfamily II DNA/RNA helicase